MSRLITQAVGILFLLGWNVQAEVVKCIGNEDYLHVIYLDDQMKDSIKRYEQRGFSCQSIQLQSPSQSNTITYRRGNAEVIVHLDPPSYPDGTTLPQRRARPQLTDQQCIEKIKRTEAIVTPEVMRCYRRIAPEILSGKPLTPEHARLFTADFNSSTYAEAESFSRRMYFRPFSEIENLRSCLEVKTDVLSAVRKASKGKIKKLVKLKNQYFIRARRAPTLEEKRRILRDLSGQVELILPSVASVQKCSLGRRSSKVGQMAEVSVRTRSTSPMKMVGEYDFTNDILSEAAQTARHRGRVSASPN